MVPKRRSIILRSSWPIKNPSMSTTICPVYASNCSRLTLSRESDNESGAEADPDET